MRALLFLCLTGCYDSCRTPSAEQIFDDSCTLQTNGFGPPGTTPVTASVVASGLEVPWAIAFMPNGKVMVTERAGRVRIIDSGVVASPVVSNSPGSEKGLLGLALHPGFGGNRFFYIYFTTNTENRVERWRLDENDAVATFDRNIVGGIAAAPNHDAGRLRFGPDGLLYIGTGDAQVPSNAQATGLNGKILRVQDDGSELETVVTGLRNPEGFDWLADGRMVIADHGPSGELGGLQGYDEVSIASAGDNLGWPTVHGCTKQQGLSAPIIAFKEPNPPGGLSVYGGGSISEWAGSVLFGSLGGKHLHRIVLDGDLVTAHETYFLNAFGRMRDVVVGPDNELYVLTSNCDGRGECPPARDAVLKVTAK